MGFKRLHNVTCLSLLFKQAVSDEAPLKAVWVFKERKVTTELLSSFSRGDIILKKGQEKAGVAFSIAQRWTVNKMRYKRQK